MRSFRPTRILTCVALALAVVSGGGSVLASQDTGALEAVVTKPEPSNSPLPADAPAPASNASVPVPPTSEDAPPREPANLPVAADVSIVEKLREFATGKLGRFFDRKNERAAVETFYAGRGFSPIWIENGVATAHAKAAVARIKAADQDGLNPSDYSTPDFAAATSPEALAEAELKLTSAVLTYARHAQIGPIHYTRVGQGRGSQANIFYKQDVLEPADILAKVTAAKDVAAALDSYNPPQAGYKALKAKLAELRKDTGGDKSEWKGVRVPDGPLLRPGDRNPRVALLRKRMNVQSDEASLRYDEALVEAVKNFQKEKDLRPDGVIGPGTIAALNGKARGSNAADIVVANMLRWRWMPRDLGNTYSMLNIPDFTMKVVRDGTKVWETKVVVGKPSKPTPIFSDTMKFITVNPTWNVPPSIVNEEYLPALEQDPTVLDRMGIKVVRNGDGSVRMYQPPGDGNALGRLRFNFPNEFLVYQHDTPDKYLFDKTARAYSHGCMRVQDPFKYAELLLSIVMPEKGYTQKRLRGMIGPAEVNIKFPTSIPVHITYQTAFVDDAGKLVVRDDVYGQDARVLAELKKDERRNLDIAVIPVARQDNGNVGSRDRARIGDPREATAGPSFFERLFR